VDVSESKKISVFCVDPLFFSDRRPIQIRAE
jgi:hypothetical protein